MEALGRLAGGVAHDFNNLLTALSSYSAQLLGSIPENHAARKPALEIGKIVDQAAMLTRQLLAFSRKQTPRPRLVELNGVIGDMEALLRRLLGESIEVILELSPDAGAVMADPGQIQQVILNLAVNARDAMPDGGRMTVATSNVVEKSKNFALLTVSDTGAGMDSGTRARLFEPFFTTKPAGSGTGLGLAMVRGIVEQSGGRIRVESAPHRGTSFQIYFPRALGPGPASSEARARGTETILLVEDSTAVRSLVREMLEQRGYTVVAACDSEEAFSVAGSYAGEIHLLLTDLSMPRVGGHDLARRLRRKRKNLRVIYMSASPGTGENFLEKPFKPEMLAAMVRNVLDRA